MTTRTDSPGISAPAPSGTTERIAVLDILRGFALFGMILVHFHQRFRLTTPDIALWPGESLSEWVMWVGLEQKAAATFAFLFGVGFAIAIGRMEARGRPAVPFYLRRLAMLALIGAAVEALAGAQILIHLALWGVPLLLVRRWSPRSLVLLAVAVAPALSLYSLGLGVHEVLTGVGAPALGTTSPAEPSTYVAEVEQRLTAMQGWYLRWRTLIPDSTFVLFLIGLAALRRGVFDDPRRHVRLIVRAMAFGAASWLAYWLVLPNVPEGWTDWSRHAWPIRYGMGIISDQWLAFTYIGALVLLIAWRPRWTERLTAFSLAGRMAFTNYVLQAIIIYCLQSEFGFGLHLRPSYRIVGGMAVFAVLVLLSQLWLKSFRYGPLEWIWRAFSHGRVPAMRNRVQELAPATPALSPARLPMAEVTPS